MKDGIMNNEEFEQMLDLAEMLGDFVDQREARGMTVQNNEGTLTASIIIKLIFDLAYETKDEGEG